MKYAWMLCVVLMTSKAVRAAPADFGWDYEPVEPAKSRFEVLRDAYQSASDVPEATDFIPPPKTDLLCVGAVPERPDSLSPYYVRVLQKVLSDSLPGNGPLFPPVRGVTENTVVFGNEKTVSQAFPAGFTNRIGNRDFEIHVTPGTYEDVPEAVTVLFRRKREFLPFKAVKTVESGSSDAFLYGYCFFEAQD